MAKNNHFEPNSLASLDNILRQQAPDNMFDEYMRATAYAESIVAVENCIAVVSNLADNTSRIIAGKFADTIDLGDYGREDSIWEKKILSLMTERGRREKYIAELRFFHYLKRIVPSKREDYFLFSGLRFHVGDNRSIDVQHRMYYIHDSTNTRVVAAVCLYSPMLFDCGGRSYAVNSVTGVREELTHSADDAVLSRRERQVLTFIDSGMKSCEIADALNISIHTVNRHRQSILERLKVKNSHEACRIAKSMSII